MFCNRLDENLTGAFPYIPGNRGIICGNGDCLKIDHLESFSKCRNCKTRRYCTEPCRQADWKIHKKECIKKEKVSEESENKQKSEKKSFDFLISEQENLDLSSLEVNDKEDDKEKQPKWKGQQKKKEKAVLMLINSC